MKNNIKKITIFIFTFINVLLFACNSNNVKETLESTVETTIVEAKEIDMPIDVSDIADGKTRERLLRIDALNKKLGDLIYVSKEDYLKYRDTKVSLIGDSISDNSRGSLKKYFNNLYQDSVSGRELEKGIEVFDTMKDNGKLMDVMVFSLGTNAKDGMLMDVFEHVYKGIEGRPMVVVNTYFPYRGQVRNRNREIKKFVDTHDNCYLADWHACVCDHRDEYIVEDGTHPNGAGGEVYAQLVFKAVIEAMGNQ